MTEDMELLAKNFKAATDAAKVMGDDQIRAAAIVERSTADVSGWLEDGARDFGLNTLEGLVKLYESREEENARAMRGYIQGVQQAQSAVNQMKASI